MDSLEQKLKMKQRIKKEAINKLCGCGTKKLFDCNFLVPQFFLKLITDHKNSNKCNKMYVFALNIMI